MEEINHTEEILVQRLEDCICAKYNIETVSGNDVKPDQITGSIPSGSLRESVQPRTPDLKVAHDKRRKAPDHVMELSIQGFCVKIDNHFDNFFILTYSHDKREVPDWIWRSIINSSSRLGIRLTHPRLLDLFYITFPLNFHRIGVFDLHYCVSSDYVSITVNTNQRFESSLEVRGAEISFFLRPADPGVILSKYSPVIALVDDPIFPFRDQQVKRSYLNHCTRLFADFLRFCKICNDGKNLTDEMLDDALIRYLGLSRHIVERVCCGVSRPNNQGYLVGVELNPGPASFDNIVAYYSALDRLETTTSRNKRYNNTSREVVQEAKLKRKQQAVSRKLKRMVKHIVPEAGLLTGGLDKTTLAAVNEVVDTLKNISNRGVGVTVSTNFGIIDTLKGFTDVLQGGIGDFIVAACSVLRVIADQCFNLLREACSILYAFAKPYFDEGTRIIFDFVVSHVFKVSLDDLTADSLSDYQPESGATLFSLLVHAPTLKMMVQEGTWASIEKALKTVGKTASLIKAPWAMFVEIVHSLFKLIADCFNFDYIKYFSLGDDVDRLYAEYQALRKEWYDGVEKGFYFTASVQQLQLKIERLFLREKDPDQRYKIDKLLNGVRHLTLWAQSNFSLHGSMKPEPLGILLTGPTNVGKSTFLHTITANILANHLSDEEAARFIETPSEFIFNRNVSSKHWDGYSMTAKIVIYDDFGQKRDIAGAPESEALEIISAINTAPFPLPMAELADKGKFYFTAPYVIANTNLPQLTFDSINESRAVVRRFKVAFCQVPKLEWCTSQDAHHPFDRKIDFARVRKHFGEVDFDKPSTYAFKDIYEFIEWDFNSGKQLEGGRVFNFHEFIKHIVDFSKNNEKKSKHLSDFMHQETLEAFKSAKRDAIVAKLNKKTASSGKDVVAVLPSPTLLESVAPEVTLTLPQPIIVPEMGIVEGLARTVGILPYVDTHKPPSPPIDPLVTDNGYDKPNQESEPHLTRVVEEIEVKLGVCWPGDPFRKLKESVKKSLAVKVTAVVTGVAALAAAVGYILSKVYQVWSVTTESDERADKLKAKPRSQVKERHNSKGDRWKTVRRRAKVDQWAYSEDFSVEGGPKGGAHTPLADFTLSLNRKNVYVLQSNDYCFGFVTFVKGRTFVCPLHFIEYWKEWEERENVQVEVQFACVETGKVAFACTSSDLTVCGMRENPTQAAPDFCFVKLADYVCREHRDITSFFATQEPSTMVGDKRRFSMQVIRGETLVHLQGHYSFANNVEYAGRYGYKYQNSSLWYSVETDCADCGALLISLDNKTLKPQIVGIHVAGGRKAIMHAKSCLGVYLTVDEVRRSLEDLREEPALTDDVIEVEFGPELGKFPVLSSGENIVVPNKTKLEHSPISRFLPWPAEKLPAALKPFVDGSGNVVDPACIAREKYLFTPKACPIELLEAYPMVRDMVLKVVAPAPWAPRVLTYEEAVAGVPGVPFMDGINRSSSPGYPYCLKNPGKGKSFWVGREGPYDFSSVGAKQLRRDVDELVRDASLGIRSPIVYVDYLKDELRPKSRVVAGQTRQFMSCPMHYLIAVKQYFGDFARSICANNKFNGVTVGIDCVSEWKTLISVLQAEGDRYYIAGDYKSFDAKLPYAVSDRVLQIIQDFYYNATDEERRVRQILFADIVNSRHISNGVIYEYHGGNPSGQPLTAVLNSIANLLMLHAVLMRASRQLGENYLQWTTFATNGDDHIIGLPNRSQISHEMIAQIMADMWGYEYTDELKGSGPVGRRKLSEINYLKRGFAKIGSTVVCPLSLDTLRETIHWCRKGFTRQEFKLRVEEVFLEYSMHGRAVFETYVPHIVRAYASVYPEDNLRYTRWAGALKAIAELRI